MTESGNRGTRTLDDVLTPYMDIDGVAAAALVSTDGLLVATTGDDSNLEAIAANSASAMSSAVSLAEELGSNRPRIMTLELTGQTLVFAPLTIDLFLVLVGSQRLLAYARDHRPSF